MKCWVCDGLGVVYKSRRSAFRKETCTRCNGTGEIQTNEEWFCGLSTEEKARWLENKMTWAAQEQGTFTAKGWAKWLKQPHKE